MIGKARGAGRDDGKAVLRALERRGWIEESEEPVPERPDGRVRAVWRPTAEGSRVVADERGERVFDDPPAVPRDVEAPDLEAIEPGVLANLSGSGDFGISFGEIDFQ